MRGALRRRDVVDARAAARREIRCPADGALVAEVDEAERRGHRAAIAAAHGPSTTAPGRGTRPGARRPAAARGRPARARHRRVAELESLDTGKRLVESEYDVADVVRVFRHYGRVAAEEAGRMVDTGNPDVVSRIVHEPVGVCGLITPWNYPLLQVSWKVAPCLAAGNTFVLKPSELTPHTAVT